MNAILVALCLATPPQAPAQGPPQAPQPPVCGKENCNCGCREGEPCRCAAKKTAYEWRHFNDDAGGWSRLYADGVNVGVYSHRWGEYYPRTGWGPVPVYADKASPCPTDPPVRRLHMPREVTAAPPPRPAYYYPVYWPVQTYQAPQPVYQQPQCQPTYYRPQPRYAAPARAASC